jgi:hypothetical protein
MTYDRLVFALGNRLTRPPIPDLETYAFGVDTFESATWLKGHLDGLSPRSPRREACIPFWLLAAASLELKGPVKWSANSARLFPYGHLRMFRILRASFLPTTRPGSAQTWVRPLDRSLMRHCNPLVSRRALEFSLLRLTRRRAN